MINIAYCKDITDSSLRSLSKCSRLNTLESRGCPLITSLGLAAIAVGCKQLSKLDIKKCPNIDDTGMIPLAHFSQNLRQVLYFLPYFPITSQADKKERMFVNYYILINFVLFLLIVFQINLSYTSVTDMGLLSLASISCLQSLTILHLNGLTPVGLAASLLVCGGLTKVKLQACFKSLLSQALFEHLEARGCVFQWRDKVLQVTAVYLPFCKLFVSKSSFVNSGSNYRQRFFVKKQ